MKKYSVKIILGYCVAVPLIFSIFSLFMMILDISNILIISILFTVAGLGSGIHAAYKGKLPETFWKRYLPVVLPLVYTLLSWMVCSFISGGFYGHNVWTLFAFLQFPFIFMSFVSLFSGIGILLFLPPVLFYSTFLLSFFITERSQEAQIKIHKGQFISAIIILLVLFTMGQSIHVKRSQTVLPSYDFDYEGGYSSTDLWPYNSDNPDHILPRLNETPTFTIADSAEAPILDGAEAAYPVYSAFAFATYNESLGSLDETYVTFTNTIYAYERLLNKEIDIYFGAEPSAEQLKMAEDADLELLMTPIGKEAFVFFVNEENPIESLNVADIQKIYSGEITNWQDIGGKNEKIVAFQRPKNSGSQTLLEKVMGDIALITPLKEDVPAGMGGILEQVADYRNYSNALGFSFRFFASKMHDVKNMKFIAINGIDPSTKHISNGTYPFSANLYAITLKDNSKSTIEPFLEWMQDPQGQEIIEEIGYVNLDE